MKGKPSFCAPVLLITLQIDAEITVVIIIKWITVLLFWLERVAASNRCAASERMTWVRLFECSARNWELVIKMTDLRGLDKLKRIQIRKIKKNSTKNTKQHKIKKKKSELAGLDPPTSEFFSDFWNFLNLTRRLSKYTCAIQGGSGYFFLFQMAYIHTVLNSLCISSGFWSATTMTLSMADSTESKWSPETVSSTPPLKHNTNTDEHMTDENDGPADKIQIYASISM